MRPERATATTPRPKPCTYGTYSKTQNIRRRRRFLYVTGMPACFTGAATEKHPRRDSDLASKGRVKGGREKQDLTLEACGMKQKRREVEDIGNPPPELAGAEKEETTARAPRSASKRFLGRR